MKRRARLCGTLVCVVLGSASASALAAPLRAGVGPAPPQTPVATGSDKKLDGNLLSLAAIQARHGDVRAAARAEDLGVAGDRVGVDVYVNGRSTAAVAPLKALGMNVTGTTDLGPVPVVEGTVPIAALHAVAGLGVTKGVLPITGGGVDRTGSAGPLAPNVSSTEGGVAHRVAQARALCNCNGAGVPVGVISDSMAKVNGGADFNASKANGNVPPNVTILQDYTGSGGSDEGRAMAELIFDEAPGLSNIFFQTGISPTAGQGPVAKTNAINNLTAQGVKVIADANFYTAEPFSQDGMVAQAVDAAAANGVAYYASAGNRARQAYQAQFVDDGG